MASKNQIEYEFNPVKESKDGKEAERVIWSTASLNRAIDAIKKGLPLKANPFVGKMTQLLKPNLVYKRTKEEIEDYIHCKQDPVYFATKCFLMTPEGLQPCKMRDYQENYLHHLQNNRFSILLSCRQAGKTLNLLTNIDIKISIKYLKNYGYILEKYYFYINDDFIYITLPMFELYNLYCEQTLIWKCKYQLYKIIYRLTYGRKKGNEN